MFILSCLTCLLADELLRAITKISKQVANSEDIEAVEILTEDANNLVETATDSSYYLSLIILGLSRLY